MYYAVCTLSLPRMRVAVIEVQLQLIFSPRTTGWIVVAFTPVKKHLPALSMWLIGPGSFVVEENPLSIPRFEPRTHSARTPVPTALCSMIQFFVLVNSHATCIL